MKRRKIILASVFLLAVLAAATTPAVLRVLAHWGARAAAKLQTNDLDSRTFASDGVRLRYIVKGTGEPVMLVHGFASSVEHNWLRTGVIDALVDAGFQVIAHDTRGHGRSAKPHDPAAYGANDVRDIIRLLDHLRLRQAHLVGYSRGAKRRVSVRDGVACRRPLSLGRQSSEGSPSASTCGAMDGSGYPPASVRI